MAIVAAWKNGACGTGFGWRISRSRLWNGKRSRFLQHQKARPTMKYRHIEYTVVQGIERGRLKNGRRRVAGVVIMGQAANKI